MSSLSAFFITPFKIAMAFAAMIALLMVFAMQRIPIDPPIVVAVAAEPIEIPLKKADRLTVATESKPVADAARIVPPAPDGAPASMPPVLLVADEDKPALQHRRQHAETNICTKHHMHKVWINGNRWRCRK